VGLALAATLLAIWFKISRRFHEIVGGHGGQLVIGVFLTGLFGFAQGDSQGIAVDHFLGGNGCIVLKFLPVRT